MSASLNEREDSAQRCLIHGGPPWRSRNPQGAAHEVLHDERDPCRP